MVIIIIIIINLLYAISYKHVLIYVYVQGEVEAELSALGFTRISIWRPALLICDRQERRPLEAAVQMMAKPMLAMFPTVGTTPCSTLAKAMVNDVVVGKPDTVTIMNNKDIFVMAGEINEKKSSKGEGTKVV